MPNSFQNRHSALPSVAQSHLIAGRFKAALQAFREASTLDPCNPDYLFGMGCAALALGENAKAAASFKRALDFAPHDVAILSNYATALSAAGRKAEAIVPARQAHMIAPWDPELTLNLAKLYFTFGAVGQALATLNELDRALECRADVAMLRGMTLLAAGQRAEAIVHLRVAHALAANDPELALALAKALRADAQPREAIEVLAPHNPAMMISLEYILLAADCYIDIGEVQRAMALAEKAAALTERPTEQAELAKFMAFHSLYREDLDRVHADVLHDSASRRLKALTPKRLGIPGRIDWNELRIGIVSPDLRRHAVLNFLLGVMPVFGDLGVRLSCYYCGSEEDEFTDKVRAHTHTFRSVVGRDPRRAARVVADDKIDVLVDLAGFTESSGIEMFGYRPAPLQVSWLGYPSGIGQSLIDARITDSWADPPGTENPAFEHLVRLPSFLTYSPIIIPPPTVERAYGPVTFGSFNNPNKIGALTAEVWAEILRATPGSRLVLRNAKYRIAEARNRVEHLLTAAGLDVSRVDCGPFACAEDINASLATYKEIDIALDPVVYNGTTTTCEALWMGVPLVAFPGDRHSARVGVSLLKAAGLDELVAINGAQARDMIVALANDRPRLAHYRVSLRTRLQASKLTDHVNFARNFIAGLRESATRPSYRF